MLAPNILLACNSNNRRCVRVRVSAVFTLSFQAQTITRDEGEPLELRIEIVYHLFDEKRAKELLRWMVKERHFKIGRSQLRSTFGGFTGDIVYSMEHTRYWGGVVPWFMGPGNEAIAREFYSDDFLEYLADGGAVIFDPDQINPNFGIGDVTRDCLPHLGSPPACCRTHP